MSDLISRSALLNEIEITSFEDYGDYRKMREIVEDFPSERDCGYTGVEDDSFVKLKEVIDITAETGALETQRRIRELSRITYPEQSRSAQLEQKKEKWLTQTQYCDKHGLVPSGLGAYFWCLCCGEAVERQSNFCPNCGADCRDHEGKIGGVKS